MYKCNECGEVFEYDEIREEKTTYESYYGVSGEFLGSTPMTIQHCPHCDSEDFDEYTYDDEFDDEFEDEDELEAA